MSANVSVPSGGNSNIALSVLRVCLGLIYFFFGFLKFFPDLSPAEMLATQTVIRLSWSFMDAHLALQTLAVMECLIGIGLLFHIVPRLIMALLLFHLIGTFLPLFILPELTFKFFPFAPTMEGQYIMKNLVFVSGGWAVLMPALERRPGARQVTVA